MQALIFFLLSTGLYLLIVQLTPRVYAPAVAALKARSPVKLTGGDKLINSLGDLVLRYIHIEPIKRERMITDLQSVDIAISPELYKARAIARGIFHAAPTVVLTIISPFMLIAAAMVCWQTITSSEKKLKAKIQARKERIERELPQFAGTIRQSLNSTRSIITILESYQRVCGDTLRREIEITLNDIKTGNTERALKSLDGRISSSKFSELVRGLVGIDHGEEMKVYFDVLAMEYKKSQNEAVKKELLMRPARLDKYMAILFVCLFLLAILAMGMMITSQLKLFV